MPNTSGSGDASDLRFEDLSFSAASPPRRTDSTSQASESAGVGVAAAASAPIADALPSVSACESDDASQTSRAGGSKGRCTRDGGDGGGGGASGLGGAPLPSKHEWARTWMPSTWRMGDGSAYVEPVAGSSLLMCLQSLFELGKGTVRQPGGEYSGAWREWGKE